MSGFRRGRSAIDNVIDLVSSIQEQIDSCRFSAAVFLDINAAFDSVLPQSIINALEDLGLGGRLFCWIQSYPKVRRVFISTEDGDTQHHEITRGIPQGGGLSPTHLNLVLIGLAQDFANDIQASIYADDICIWASEVTRVQLRARLQNAINIIDSYLKTCGLAVSTTKSAVVAFTRRNMDKYAITISGQKIPFLRQHMFLGITIDRGLTWAPHIRYLAKKVTGFIDFARFLCGTT